MEAGGLMGMGIAIKPLGDLEACQRSGCSIFFLLWLWSLLGWARVMGGEAWGFVLPLLAFGLVSTFRIDWLFASVSRL